MFTSQMVLGTQQPWEDMKPPVSLTSALTPSVSTLLLYLHFNTLLAVGGHNALVTGLFPGC